VSGSLLTTLRTFDRRRSSVHCYDAAWMESDEP
jgi:hypothetical protein